MHAQSIDSIAYIFNIEFSGPKQDALSNKTFTSSHYDLSNSRLHGKSALKPYELILTQNENNAYFNYKTMYSDMCGVYGTDLT